MDNVQALELCPLCKGLCRYGNNNSFDIQQISCRVCGTFQMTYELLEDLPSEKKLTEQLHKVSAYTFHRSITRKGTKPITLFYEKVSETPEQISIFDVVNMFPKHINDKIDNALQNLAALSSYEGKKVEIRPENYPLFYPSSKELEATEFIFRQLIHEGYIMTTKEELPSEVVLTVKGWSRIAEVEKGLNFDSKQVFVAMWFDSCMNIPYEEGIKKAISMAGFTALKINEKEHNSKIDDEIIAEIRRSRFVVCDFTGHRGGVYFEAGFAMGLGIPVIWTCKSDQINNIHFDTRQYNHIVWETEEDLYQKLFYRIKATIT